MTAIELVAASAAVPVAGTLTGAAAVAGQTLTVRNEPGGTDVRLDGLWAQGTSVNDIRIRSPRMSDFVNGIRLRVKAANVIDLLPGDLSTMLVPQDTPTVEIGNTGVAETDLAFLLLYYSHLTGADGNFATWDQVKPRIAALTSNEIASTGGAAAAWSAGVFFSAGSWAPDPNTNYAVLGYECDAAVGAVAFFGTDTGNLRSGGPGNTDPTLTRDYFKRRSVETGRPYIPIVNSANNGTTTLQHIAAGAVATATFSLLLAQLTG